MGTHYRSPLTGLGKKRTCSNQSCAADDGAIYDRTSTVSGYLEILLAWYATKLMHTAR